MVLWLVFLGAGSLVLWAGDVFNSPALCWFAFVLFAFSLLPAFFKIERVES